MPANAGPQFVHLARARSQRANQSLLTAVDFADDLIEHRDHHERGVDFAWTVLDPRDGQTVIGCVYLKPDPTGRAGATARAWVRAADAHLDETLRAHLRPWLVDAWPLPIRWD